MRCASPLGTAPAYALAGAGAAIASPLLALLSGNLHEELLHLVHLSPWSSLVGAAKDQHVAGKYYRTTATDTLPDGTAVPHLLWQGILSAPPNREVRIYSAGAVNESASMVGTLTVLDPRRELLAWLAMTWRNRELSYYLGTQSLPLNAFATVLRGVTTNISPQADRIALGFAGVTAKLGATYQTKTYAGRGPCLRFDGASGYAPGTVSCPTGSMTLGFRMRRRAVISADSAIAGWRSGAAAGERRAWLTAAGAVTWQIRDDAGALFSIAGAAALPTAWAWHDFWCVLDTAAGLMLLYDGAVPDVPIAEAAIPAGSTWVTTLTGFALARLADAASGYLPADLDEVTVWDQALGPVDIAQWTAHRPPSGTAHLVRQWSMTEGTGGTAYESAGAGPDLTLTGAATWVASLTGGDELTGKRVPKGRGIVRSVPPAAVSANEDPWIYQLAETFDRVAADALGPIVEDGGVRVWALKGTYPDPWATTLAVGEYLEVPSMGLIRLGSAPVRQLHVDVYLTAATDLPSCVLGVLTGDGALAAGEVNAGSAGDLPATQGVGVWAGLDPMTIDSQLLVLLRSVKGWRAEDPGGALAFGVLAPPESLPASAWIGGDDVLLDTIRPIDQTEALKSATVLYRRRYVTQQPGTVNPTLDAATVQDLGQEWRTSTTPDDLAVLKADAAAEAGKPIETALDTEEDARALAAGELAWTSKPRRSDFLPYSEPVPQHVVGQRADVYMPALDYDEGKPVVVVAVVADPAAGVYGVEVSGLVLAVGTDVSAGPGTDSSLSDGAGGVLDAGI